MDTPPADTVAIREAMRGLAPFLILIAVVVAAAGPWSHLSEYNFVKPEVDAVSSLSGKASSVSWAFAPVVAGTWILGSWIVIPVMLRVRPAQLADVFAPRSRRCGVRCWSRP